MGLSIPNARSTINYIAEIWRHIDGKCIHLFSFLKFINVRKSGWWSFIFDNHIMENIFFHPKKNLYDFSRTIKSISNNHRIISTMESYQTTVESIRFRIQSTQPYSNFQSQNGGERHTLLRLGRFSNDLWMIGSRHTGNEANRLRSTEIWLSIWRDRFRDQVFAIGDFVFDFGIRCGLSFGFRDQVVATRDRFRDQVKRRHRWEIAFAFGDIGEERRTNRKRLSVFDYISHSSAAT